MGVRDGQDRAFPERSDKLNFPLEFLENHFGGGRVFSERFSGKMGLRQVALAKDVATSKTTFASELKKQMSNMSRHLPRILEIPSNTSEMSRHVSTFAIVLW